MSGCLSGSPCDDILTLIGEQVMVQRARQNFSQVLKHIEEGDESDGDLLHAVLEGTPMIPAKMPDYLDTVVDMFPFWEWDDDGYGDGDEGREWDEEWDELTYKEESIFYRWGKGNGWGGNMWNPW